MKGIKLFRNRKAVSPLIATVLLIAFAVALGAVVMNWGRGYIETTADFAQEKSDTEIRCSMDIGLKFIEIGDTPQICFNNNTDDEDSSINFTIENTGTIRLSGIKVQAFGSDSIAVTNINASLGPSDVTRAGMPYYGEGNGSLIKVRFIPQIKVGREEVLCAKNDLSVEDIDPC